MTTYLLILGVKDAESITNIKKNSAKDALDAYNKGLKGSSTDLKTYHGKELSSSDTSRLHSKLCYYFTVSEQL